VVDELNPSGYAQVLEEHVSLNSQPPSLGCCYTYGHALISEDRFNGSQWVPSFYGYDGHNSVRYLTDANANVTDTYDYDAFANLIAQSSNSGLATPNSYLFTGEQYDAGLGLYYLRARCSSSFSVGHKLEGCQGSEFAPLLIAMIEDTQNASIARKDVLALGVSTARISRVMKATDGPDIIG
jgi:hypothetical protein